MALMHRKKILKTSLILVVTFVILSTLYINIFIAPTKLKTFLVANISRVVDRPVSIKSVRFNFIQGFIINDLIIYEPDAKTQFIKVERISTTLLFIPVLWEKKIIIPSIRIDLPAVNIVKDEDNTWNFSAPPLLKKPPAGERPARKGFSILVQKVIFNNGKINFSDNTRLPAYAKELINIDGRATFSPKNIIQFKANAHLNSPEKTVLALGGSYDLGEKLFSMKAVLKNLSLLEPYNYFYKMGLFTTLKNGSADFGIDLKIDRDKKISLGVNSAVKNLDIEYYGLNLKGNMDISGNSTLDLTETFKADFKIDVTLKNSCLKGVYILNEITNLNGKIEIGNEGISSPLLEGLAYNTPIRFMGGVKDIKAPQLRSTIQSNLDLSDCRNFLPEELKSKFKDAELQGPAELNIKLFDNLLDPQPVSIDATLITKGATLKIPSMPNKFEKVSGEVRYKDNIAYLSRVLFTYGPRDYIVDAKISDFKSPDVKMKLKTDDIALDSRFRLNQDNIHILRISGKYLNSLFKATGDITNLKKPNVLLRGDTVLDLTDLRKIFPNTSETLTKLDIKGICNLELYLNGTWEDPRNFEATIKGASDNINAWGLKLNDVKLDLNMKDKRFAVSEFSAKPYDGTLLATMDMDSTQPNPPYMINLGLEGIDLSKLILDTNLKDKPISGEAFLKASLRGYGKNMETIKGEGRLYIKGGKIWEIPLLKGLADLLFLPNLSSIVFDEVSSDFTIVNKSVSTGNLALHSQNVSLLGEGGVSFDGTIDLLITTTISENFAKGTSEFSRLASTLLAKAGQLIGNIRIIGTIKKPEYKFIPLPVDKILKDKLKGLLGGFF